MIFLSKILRSFSAVKEKHEARDSNLELLRILAMLMIVAHHFSCHSNMPIWGPFEGSHFFSFIWSQWLLLGGKIGVELFVMISGYFLIIKCGHLVSLLKLMIVTAFYGAVLYLIFNLNKDNLSVSEFIQNLKPGSYWFISCYIALFLLTPFLRIGLIALSKWQYFAFCVVSFLSLVSTDLVPGCNYFKGPLFTFIVCFMIAGYVRMHVKEDSYNSKLVSGCLVILVAGLLLWTWFCDVSGQPGNYFIYADLGQWPTILISLCLLLLFRKIHLGHIVFINKCGGVC